MSSSNGEQDQQHPPPSSPPKRRPFCLRCSKPARLCLCSRIKTPPLDNPIGVTILQHSREKNHPLNSARVASLGLRNLDIFSVSDANFRAEFTVVPLSSCQDGGAMGSSGNGGSHVGNAEDSKHVAEMDTCGVDCSGKTETDSEEVHLSAAAEESNGIVDEKSVARSSGKVNGEDRDCFLQFPSSQTHQQKLIGEDQGGVTCLESDEPTEEIFDLEGQIEDKDEDDPIEMKPNVKKAGGKCYVSCCPDHLLIFIDRGARPDLDWVLATPIGKAVVENGFTVKKVQRKKLSGCVGFKDFEEFSLVVPPGSALLFPGKKSINPEEVGFQVKHLFVLDGTWAKARRMYYDNPWLKFLPHLKLEAKEASLYSEVRHQPKAGCLSTIESIICAMKTLGGGMDGLDTLLDVFASMVDDQRRCREAKFGKTSKS